jgi:AP-3 complex subunit delta
VKQIYLEISTYYFLFTAKKRSDKYLEESRKSQRKEKKAEKSKKSKKKSKKNKPELASDSDSDEPKPMHVVNTTIEMPEGAVMSDTDDKNDLDVNDPHRALDIDLDAEDDFYAPKLAKVVKKVIEPEPVKSTHRKKKEIEPVLLMDSEEGKKKEKKKHKRKKEVEEVNLLETSESVSTEKKKSKKKSKEKDPEKPKKHKKSMSKKEEYEEPFGSDVKL